MQALDEHIRSFYPSINFTMICQDYKEIQFLNLTVYVQNGFSKTKIFQADRQPRVFRCMVIAPRSSI